MAPSCFRAGLGSSDPEHYAQLKEAFNAPPSYGIDINWNDYTAADAAHVLYDYLKSLPEPLIPSHLSCKLPSLEKYIQRNYVPSDPSSLQVYAICLARMPKINRQLLLFLIALLAAQAEFAERGYWNSNGGFYNEAAECWSSVLAHPLEYRLATFTLLIVNAGYFLGVENRRRPTPAEWNRIIEARANYAEMEEIKMLRGQEIKFTEAHEANEATEQENTYAALLGDMGEDLQEQAQRELQEREQGSIQHSAYESGRENESLPKHKYQPTVEDADSGLDDEIRTLSQDDTNAMSNETVVLSQQESAWQPVEHEFTDTSEELVGHTEGPAVQVEGEDEDAYKEHRRQDDLVSSPLPEVEPKPEPEPPVVLEPPPANKEEDPWGGGWGTAIGTSGTVEENKEKRHVEKEPPRPPQSSSPEPEVGADITGVVSLSAQSSPCGDPWGFPQTTKTKQAPSLAPPPDSEVIHVVNATEERRLDRQHQKKGGRTVPEPMPEPNPVDVGKDIGEEDRAHQKHRQASEGHTVDIPPVTRSLEVDDVEAEGTVRLQRRHRRSAGSYASVANETRPRSAVSGSEKGQGRQSKDETEGQQHVKKHKKVRSIGAPKKGFRAWFHGIG